MLMKVEILVVKILREIIAKVKTNKNQPSDKILAIILKTIVPREKHL